MPLYLTSHMDQSDPSTAMNTSMPNNINYHRCATPNDVRVFLSGKLMWLLLAIINHGSQQTMLWLVLQDESLQVHLLLFTPPSLRKIHVDICLLV